MSQRYCKLHSRNVMMCCWTLLCSNHLRIVITFYSQLYYCLACQVRICTKCHPAHNPGHLPFLVHTEIRPGRKESSSQSETCIRCLAFTKRGKLQCKSCSFRLCPTCVNQLVCTPPPLNPLVRHVGENPTHKRFVVRIPPSWTVKKPPRDFPKVGPGFVGCCQRCHKCEVLYNVIGCGNM
jgi:hypothetical protein